MEVKCPKCNDNGLNCGCPTCLIDSSPDDSDDENT